MRRSRSSMPSGPTCCAVLRIAAQPRPGHLGNVGLKSGSSETPGHVCSVGVPSFWKILKIVSISESPQKRGAPVAISALMQPMLQRSTGTLYRVAPRRISGGRYQTVTTSWVYFGTGTVKARARPKSAIFKCSRWSMRRFWGFRSRWMMRFEWQNSTPRQSWYAKFLTAAGVRRPFNAFMYFFKSFSRNSNTSTSLFGLQKTSRSRTTFGCESSFSNAISLMAVLGTPSSCASSFICFMATNSPVRLLLAL
mmetsp:Transcript_121292/g.368789  ORF Transcript_121292/g.368789 Transcript_121292/m.368789 type:complete len:251 (+) Transcript_121292:184-936(+)